MGFGDEVFEKVLETIDRFFRHGINSDVVIVYEVEDGKVSQKNIEIVDSGWKYFEEHGYYVSGLKSYSKIDGEKKFHGYIIFETQRILGTIGRISQDLENIQQDLSHKI